MSSQAGAVTAREFPTTIPINHENRRVVDSLKQKIARRAYELFEHGGRAEGNDMRHWITVNGVLYAPVGKPGSTQNCTPTPTACGGALVRYTGNFATLPPLPVPGPGNNFNQIPACGTTSQVIPPGPPGSFLCFAFQDEGDFDGVGTDVAAHTEINPTTNQPDTRLVVASWPPPSSGRRR